LKLPRIIQYAAAALVAMLLLALNGCATGYQLHLKNGVETLYHIDASGTKQTIYVVNKDGSLQIHDENDPLVRRIYSDHRSGSVARQDTSSSLTDDDTRHQQMLAAKLIQTGRLHVAEKRDAKDPIFVTVRAADVATTKDAERALEQHRQVFTDELIRDHIFVISPDTGDVDIFFKSYTRETTAVNLQTKKLVTVTAFYFEALIRSNYLPEVSQTICELGHQMDRREVVRRTAERLNNVIKEKFGPHIPKDRTRFLPLHLQGA